MKPPLNATTTTPNTLSHEAAPIPQHNNTVVLVNVEPMMSPANMRDCVFSLVNTLNVIISQLSRPCTWAIVGSDVCWPSPVYVHDVIVDATQERLWDWGHTI